MSPSGDPADGPTRTQRSFDQARNERQKSIFLKYEGSVLCDDSRRIVERSRAAGEKMQRLLNRAKRDSRRNK